MKYYYILFLIVLCLGCSKPKEVNLPEVSHANTTTMEDYSAVYFFYDTEQQDSLNLNRNNLISTTNWVFHIDKQFALKQIIPNIKKLQQKKADAKMHKKEGVKNYFSVNNTEIANLSFIDFTSTDYQFDDQFSKFYIDEHPAEYEGKFPITINFNKDNAITLNGTATEKDELVAFIKEFAEFSANGSETLIYLNFDENLSFQDYITDLLLVQQAKTEHITIASQQYVYNEAKLPQCGCTL